MSKPPEVKGVVFEHGENDYSIWITDFTKAENKKVAHALETIFGNNGASIRGTKDDIMQAISDSL